MQKHMSSWGRREEVLGDYLCSAFSQHIGLRQNRCKCSLSAEFTQGKGGGEGARERNTSIGSCFRSSTERSSDVGL